MKISTCEEYPTQILNSPTKSIQVTEKAIERFIDPKLETAGYVTNNTCPVSS
jgi:hypothetical protein